MKSAYIFHDAFCDPFSDWYQWMKTTLESQGYAVVVPQFPTPAGQSYESWKAVLKNYLGKFDDQTLFIGHGSGGAFALRLLEEQSVKIAGLFLVASYAEPIGHAGYDRVNESFFKKDFDWDKLKKNALVIDVFAGDNDPFVPMEATQRLADHLGEMVHIVPDGGHLNKASGFTQALQIAQGIKENFAQLDKSIEVEEEASPAPIIEAKQDTPRSTTAESSPSKREGSEPRDARTMYEDMSLLVNSKKGSVASSLLEHAREEKKVEKARNPLSTQNIIYIIGTIIILAAILAVGGYLLQKYSPAATKPSVAQVASLLQAEHHNGIAFTTSTASFQLEQAITAAITSAEKTDGVTDIFYSNGAARASFSGTLQTLGITTLPDGFSKEFPSSTSVAPSFMHGILVSGQTQAHFLMLRVQNYDNAFSLMREWEPTLFRDTAVFMHIPSNEWKSQTAKSEFDDTVIANKNMRVLKNDQHLLAYFFLNERTIIITDQPEAIPLLIKRWANSQIYNER